MLTRMRTNLITNYKKCARATFWSPARFLRSGFMAEDLSQTQNLLRALSGLLNNIMSDQPGPSGLTSPSTSADGAARRLTSPYHVHQQLFGRSGSNLGSSAGTKRLQKGKGGKSDGQKRHKRIWTHCFVCLAFPDTDTVPSALDVALLKANGLGAVSIDIDETGDATVLHTTLLKTFPKLQEAEGYELLRTCETGTKTLTVIPAPEEGYTAAYLKTVLCQAKCYIRPIQKAIKICDSPCTQDDAKVCW